MPVEPEEPFDWERDERRSVEVHPASIGFVILGYLPDWEYDEAIDQIVMTRLDVLGMRGLDGAVSTSYLNN